MSDTSSKENWTTPAAMAIPEGGFFTDRVEQGRYGPIFHAQGRILERARSDAVIADLQHEKNRVAMLELDDIQHFLLTRPRAMAARYGFLSFRQPKDGRAWLFGIIDRVGRSRGVESGGRSIRDGLPWRLPGNGLRALGVDDASLATFPDEFRQAMAGAPRSWATPEPIIPIAGRRSRQP